MPGATSPVAGDTSTVAGMRSTGVGSTYSLAGTLSTGACTKSTGVGTTFTVAETSSTEVDMTSTRAILKRPDIFEVEAGDTVFGKVAIPSFESQQLESEAVVQTDSTVTTAFVGRVGIGPHDVHGDEFEAEIDALDEQKTYLSRACQSPTYMD